uniref:Uncharacterized protein n=1 Tax=Bionectria ochroleuca TaxID=29856 RepID=A0A8H7K9E9_BIOOC
MTKGQANELLSQDLSRENGSAYLRQLNKGFDGLSILQNARIYWAYETRESRTVQLENNKWINNGCLEVLVNPDSATCGRNIGAAKVMTIPINENHSNIVKFSRGHKDLPTIIQTISELCSQEANYLSAPSIHTTETPRNRPKNPKSYLELPTLSEEDCITLKDLERLFSSIQELHELSPAELDFRADQIEDPFQDTFKWVFDRSSFSNWLQEGTGLFWAHFSKELGFRLQDYTTHDIASYAAGNLVGLNLDNASVSRLVNGIIARANGVFLWVRLAVKDMIDVSSHTNAHVSLRQMEDTLKMLPGNLYEFYKLIVERIAHTIRPNTYALLELMIRRRDLGLSVDYAWSAVTIAYCCTHQESRANWERDDFVSWRNSDQAQVRERQKGDITIWGGGLVEINDDTVQVMHQTVLEFITGFSFKRDVLGELSSIVVENGHSFHFKYLCSIASYGVTGMSRYKTTTGAELRYHGEQFELTTGNSQLAYIGSLPWRIFRDLIGESSYALKSTGELFLKFVVSHGLLLCLKEWVTNNPNQVRHFSPLATTFPLLSDLFFLGSYGVFPGRYIHMMCLLLQNGFSTRQDPYIFATVIERIWKLEANHETREDIRTPISILHELFMLLLKNEQETNTIHLNAIWAHPGAACGVKPLHVLPPHLAQVLIQHGADPNGCDDYGRTPLDWILRFPHGCIRSNRVYDTQWRYSLCRVLASVGGRTAYCNRHDWMNALNHFELEGHNTTCLRESPMGELR